MKLYEKGRQLASYPVSSYPARVRRRLAEYGERTETAIQRTWRRALVGRSQDQTNRTASRSCLVVAAHPDDETFGCAATISRKTSAGTPVRILIATDGRHANPESKVVSPEQLGVIRRAEALEAGEILGVGPEYIVQPALAHLRDTTAVAHVTQILKDLLADFGPDEILVNTALDYHPDHRAANRIVRDVTARLGFSGPVHEYPIWYLYDGPWRRGRAYFAGRPTVDESEPEPKGGAASALRLVQDPIASLIRLHPTKVQCGRYLGAKRAAVAAYRSQTTNFTGEEEWTYLSREFVSVFLQPQEIFFPVGPTRR